MNKPAGDDSPKMMPPAQIDYRLLQEEAKCARDYDDARRDLVAGHSKAEGEEEKAKGELRALRERLEALLGDEGGRGDGEARAEAKPILARLDDARSAKRASYTGALPPAEQALGQPLGTPTKQVKYQ